ncbi:hypothetical protein EDD21DRAFT_404384 [Dissophora ornata]|nr:hypothetical protein EDD21DRAFT_404384 [Dissophora ornata]
MSPLILKLKDVLHYSLDYDPTVPVEPHPLQSNPDSPLPFKKRFTCRILVVLGSRENCFSMGYSETDSEPFYLQTDNRPDSLHPSYSLEQGEDAKGPGPHRSYDWTLKHVCRHWEDEHQIPSSATLQASELHTCATLSHSLCQIDTSWSLKPLSKRSLARRFTIDFFMLDDYGRSI